MVKLLTRRCNECGKDLKDRSIRTKYCCTACKSLASIKRIKRKHKNIISLKTDIARNREKIIEWKNSECYFCGEKKIDKLQIHHKNYESNRLKNLVVLCCRCHIRLHHLLRENQEVDDE
tara:strand:+ start:306 stop:662 length:357 start_codon:yes stop_codon:yes gene_type:complete